jgi:hypothetical protein
VAPGRYYPCAMPFIRPLSGLALLAALALASCGGGSGSSASSSGPVSAAVPKPPPGFPKATQKEFIQLARAITSNGPILAATGQDFGLGKNRFGFGLFDAGRKQITVAPVALYIEKQSGGPVLGPFVAREESLRVKPPYLSQTVAKDPDAAKAVYVADVRFPSAGKYNVLGLVQLGDKLVPTGTGVRVVANDPVPGPGDRPPAIDTPTVKSVGGNVAKIDTRTPHDDMHDVSFRDVLGKKPVVLLFATPLLCQSRVCGPVTDVAEEVKHTVPEAKGVAFIHMEIYNDNNANKGFRPQVNAFHLPTEPWAFIVDKSGRISTRLEGAFSASELETAIRTAIRQ